MIRSRSSIVRWSSASCALLAVVLGATGVFRAKAGESSTSHAGSWTIRRSPVQKTRVPRAQVVELGDGTYIHEMIGGENPRLRRWPSRLDEPVRVWVAAGDSAAGWRPALNAIVQGAFMTWSSIGVPIRFGFVPDSASAEVRVRWALELPDQRDGLTVSRSDKHGWMRGADIQLALRARDGTPHGATAVRAIALHEVGHLLGLDHSPVVADIMAPLVEIDSLTIRDRATARLLYTLPAGLLE
jgi:hypothetical protein